MGDKGKGDVPKFEPAKDYEKMIKLQLKYLPKQLREELGFRQEYDPQFIEQQMGLESAYGPAQRRQQLAAWQQLDPTGYATREGLGDLVRRNLERGYVNPLQQQAYGVLGKQVIGEGLRGSRADPELLRQIGQGIESRLSGNPLLQGNAPAMARGVYTGERLRQLQQQRQANLSGFYGLQAPETQAAAQAGTFLAGRSPMDYINTIQGVQAPRAFGYVDPQSGLRGIQTGLQGMQYQYANQALQGQNSNPWMGALQGASTGMSMGSVGGPYGAAGGAVVGAAAGAFGYPQYSDVAGKENLSRTGLVTEDGIPIVEFNYVGGKARYRGVIAQDVLKKRPDAVYHFGNGKMGVFYSRLGIEMEEVQGA